MDDYLTPSEVAQRLRLNYYTIMRWIASGLLETETIMQGKRVRYRIKKSVVETIERRNPERHRVLV